MKIERNSDYIGFRIKPSLRKQLLRIARNTGRRPSEIFRFALQDFAAAFPSYKKEAHHGDANDK